MEAAMGVHESEQHKRTTGGSGQPKRNGEGEPCRGRGLVGEEEGLQMPMVMFEASRAHRAETHHRKDCGGGASRESVCWAESSFSLLAPPALHPPDPKLLLLPLPLLLVLPLLLLCILILFIVSSPFSPLPSFLLLLLSFLLLFFSSPFLSCSPLTRSLSSPLFLARKCTPLSQVTSPHLHWHSQLTVY